ncbi:MAG: ribonuclease P protein component [Alphaproteobacteria bacterium]|nr:ribonuclease P protein component [Alphaproteobacteria bacterium]
MHATKDQQASLTPLKKRADFLAVQSKGRKWVSHGLILQVRENDLGLKRLGFTVSKKVDKSAVKRNRIKRRLRAVAADVLPESALAGYDYVLVGRVQSAVRPYETLCNDLRWCLKKMDLIS